MLNKIYIRFLSLIINAIDNPNKKKIIYFFKKRLNEKSLNILDVGAHKGETIDLFYQNFNINKIFAFEANSDIFKELESEIIKKNYQKKITLFNIGLGSKEDIKYLNVLNDSSSSTFNDIDQETKYFKKKEKILSFLKSGEAIFQDKLKTKILPLSSFKEPQSITSIDILKIDTEGYELNILKGLSQDHLKKIKYIYFEHHYDLMIKKNYTYREIKNFLNKNNFYLSIKLKMNLRKTFEYIYENKKY